MKTLKTIAIAALLCSYALSCQQATPEPTAAATNQVSVKPPTDPATPTLACESVKNPAEEIGWIKKMIAEAKEQNKRCLIVQYDYKNRKVYSFLNNPGRVIFYCDGTLLAHNLGLAGTANLEEVVANLTNPVVIVDFN